MKITGWQIGSKLTAIILSVSGFTILVSMVLFTIYQQQQALSSLRESALAQARLMALYSEVPLQFDDPQAIRDILVRSEIPSLQAAVVYNANDKIYASHSDRVVTELSPGLRQALTQENGVRVADNELQILLPIGEQTDRIGSLYLHVSLQTLRDDLQQRLYLIAALAVGLLFISFLLAQSLQRYISKPILNLAGLARQIGSSRDYRARSNVVGDDEIASLARSFNHMLDVIEERESARDMAEQALRDSKLNLENAVQELQYLANYDSLTELPNRALCMDRITGALQRASRENRKVAVVFLDLDHFKEINDSLGHAVGDDLLKAASQRLLSCLRRGDTLARLGGDEFVIVLEDLQEDMNVVSVMEKIIETFSQPFTVAEYSVTTTVSLGACVYPMDGNDVQTLMRNADAAMYRAKESGRNTYQFYQPEMNALSLRRLSLVNELRAALQQQQFEVHYQPQLRTDDRSILGVEALIRWKHPVLGNVTPAEFIPIAESSGLIIDIGKWVLHSAAGQMVRWHRYGHRLRVAINLSAVQFRQQDLAEQIAAIAQRYQLPPECLELELTESMLMRDVEGAIAQMKRLKAMGFRLAIDDFGIGYSSLNYLRKFPLDVLKIDRSFVDEVTRDKDDMAITLAILSMAKTLGLTVVAEGVETQEQYQFLLENGCDEVQGYLFSPPIPEPALSKLLGQPMPFKQTQPPKRPA